MARQMERDDNRDAVPDSIPVPDILPDFNIWAETHWTEAQIHSQPSTWLTEIMLAHAESSRIQAELYDDAFRVDSKSRENRGRPIGDAEVRELQAANPKFAGMPAAALKKLYRKRSA